MNDQNLNNNSNQNVSNDVNLTTQNNNENVEVLDDNNFSSFIKQPEVKENPTQDLLNSVPKPDMMVSSPASNSISTDDLLEAFVGKNYDKITTRKFNLAAFFLTGTYLMYRKMYLLGILYTFVIVILQLLISIINPILSLLVFIGSSIALCLMFNKFYINKAKKDIDKIKKNNTNKSIEDLKVICSKKGGTNLIMTIILSIVTSILVVVLLVVFSGYLLLMLGNSMLGSLIRMFNNAEVVVENNNTNEGVSEEQAENKYNGVLSHNTDIDINNKVSIGYLQVFKPSTFNEDYMLNYEYNTLPENEKSKCSFSLAVVNGYNDPEKLIDEMASYSKIENTSSTTSTKNVMWHSFNVSSDLKTTYYNATVHDNLVYLLKYDIDPNANVNICNAFYNGILNSIEFK